MSQDEIQEIAFKLAISLELSTSAIVFVSLPIVITGDPVDLMICFLLHFAFTERPDFLLTMTLF